MTINISAKRGHTARECLLALKVRAARLPPTVKGILWTMAAGGVFSVLNAGMRLLSLQLDPFQVQFLRYFLGLTVMLAFAWRAGWATYKPKRISGHFTRGAVHTAGLALWFAALPKIGLADMTAIGFTGPIFIMMGAYLFFRESMHWERWLAALIGFVGVLVVVGPKLTSAGGYYNLVMLASAPMFAASFLLTKALTRVDSAPVIVLWQSVSVSCFSLPMAVLHWHALTPLQWLVCLLCGMMGSLGHYCLTRSFQVADISATQSMKFLDLIWASLIGWLLFGDSPSQSTLLGGALICAATIWIAGRESIRARHAEIKLAGPA